jgi:hypothetical protein
MAYVKAKKAFTLVILWIPDVHTTVVFDVPIHGILSAIEPSQRRFVELADLAAVQWCDPS